MNGLSRDRAGTASIEFLIVLTPLLLLVMGITQLSLLYVARLVVQHAAVAAVRSAVVVLDDDPKLYRGLARGQLEPPDQERTSTARRTRGTSGNEPVSMLRSIVAADSRRATIRNAAHVPLLAVAPDATRWLGQKRPSVRRALGEADAAQLLGGMLYNRAAAAVTFPSAPGADTFQASAYGVSDEVTVRVTYAYPCTVPLVSALLCTSLSELLGVPGVLTRAPSRSLADPRQWPIRNQHNRRRGQALKELKRGAAPAYLAVGNHGIRYVQLLRAEATLPNQGAAYAR